MREYSLALRLASKLADLRAANADRILPPAATERGPMEGGESKKNRHAIACLFFLEAPPGIGPGIEVLQTFALPLGHGA